MEAETWPLISFELKILYELGIHLTAVLFPVDVSDNEFVTFTS